MHRLPTLVAIIINDITVFDKSVLIPITSLLKKSTARLHSFKIYLNYFIETADICPRITMLAHLQRTQHLRSCKQFFIIFQSPFSAVCSTMCKSLPFSLYFSAICLRINIAFVVPRPGMNPNCSSVTSTSPLTLLSTICSEIFIVWDRSLYSQIVLDTPAHPPSPYK